MTSLHESPLDALAELLAERKRYEGWIAQLDGQRAQSPAHVVDRVRSDYFGRLDSVMKQLRARASDLQSSAVELRDRIAKLEAEEGTRRDERAETELRSMVGEFELEDARAAIADCDEALGRLSGERGRHSQELARIVEVLASVGEPAAPGAPDAIASDGADPYPPPVDALPGDEGQSASGEASDAESDEASDAESDDASHDADPRGTDRAPVYEETARSLGGELVGPNGGSMQRRSDAQRDDSVHGAFPSDEASQLDELAFLHSVVDDGEEEGMFDEQPPANDLPERAEQQQSDISEPTIVAPSRRATPLGATPVDREGSRDGFQGAQKESRLTPGSMPSFFKDMPTEPAKTLKCQECGTMNYPTEWYCERCGGELAAM